MKSTDSRDCLAEFPQLSKLQRTSEIHLSQFLIGPNIAPRKLARVSLQKGSIVSSIGPMAQDSCFIIHMENTFFHKQSTSPHLLEKLAL